MSLRLFDFAVQYLNAVNLFWIACYVLCTNLYWTDVKSADLKANEGSDGASQSSAASQPTASDCEPSTNKPATAALVSTTSKPATAALVPTTNKPATATLVDAASNDDASQADVDAASNGDASQPDVSVVGVPSHGSKASSIGE